MYLQENLIKGPAEGKPCACEATAQTIQEVILCDGVRERGGRMGCTTVTTLQTSYI